MGARSVHANTAVVDAIADDVWHGLDAWIEVARARWPGIDVERTVFASYLAARLPAHGGLDALNVVDLYLACACSVGIPSAIDAFRRELLPDIDAAVAAARVSAADGEDVKQQVCAKLLAGDADHPPRIVDYEGRGALRTWVRVIGARTLVSLLRRRERRGHDAEDVVHAMPGPADDPELVVLRSELRDELKAALHDAMRSLTARDRRLLRQSLLDGLTIDDLGALYGVHRVTAARWLIEARRVLWARTKAILLSKLGDGAADLESFLRQRRTHLDLSLQRALRTSH